MTVIPDVPSPIEAYRYFSIVDYTERISLYGTVTSVKWDPHIPNKASCHNNHPFTSNCHEVPNNQVHSYGKGCGFYSFKTPELLAKYLVFGRHYSRNFYIVVAKIQIWGKVIEHELGWRSEYAQIVSIGNLTPRLSEESERRSIARKLAIPYEEYQCL